MAGEKELALDTDPETGSGGGKSKLIVIIVLVLILIGAGVGAFLVLAGDSKEAATEETAVEEPLKAAQYLVLKPAFVNNYMVNNRKHYLQVEITLMSREETSVKKLEQHMPMVKNTIVGWLGQQAFYELREPDSREALRMVLLDYLRLRLEEETGEPLLEDVLFTGFVMQ